MLSPTSTHPPLPRGPATPTRRPILLSRTSLLWLTVAAILISIGWYFNRNHAAPFRLRGSPFTAYRVDGMHGILGESQIVNGWPVLAVRDDVPSGVISEIAAILNDPSSYGDRHASCFNPRLAFTWGTGDDQIQVVVCAECHKVSFKCGARTVTKGLSDSAAHRFNLIREKLFPNVHGPDPLS